MKDDWSCDATKSGSADWDNCVTQCKDIIRSTVDYFAVTKSADDNMKLSQPSTKKDIEDMVWNPNIVLGTDDSRFYPAVDRGHDGIPRDFLSIVSLLKYSLCAFASVCV